LTRRWAGERRSVNSQRESTCGNAVGTQQHLPSHGCDGLAALLEKGLPLQGGHSTLQARPGNVPHARHSLSNAGNSEKQVTATGQWNKTLPPSVVLFWYCLDSQTSSEPHCGTHHKKALPGSGRKRNKH